MAKNKSDPEDAKKNTGGAPVTGSFNEAMIRRAIESSAMGRALGASQLEFPKVQVPSLEDLKVTIEEGPAPTQQEVEDAFLLACYRQAERRPRKENEATEDGDELSVDLVAFCESQIVPFSAGKGVLLDPTGNEPFEGLYEQVVGTPVGHNTHAELLLPEDFPAVDFQGKRAIFAVQVTAATQVKESDPADPAFLKRLGLGISHEEIGEALGKRLAEERAFEDYLLAAKGVLEVLRERAQVEISDQLLDQEIGLRWREEEGQILSELDLPPEHRDTALQGWMSSPDLREQTRELITNSLLLAAVAQQEGYLLEKAEVDGALGGVAKGMGITPKALAGHLAQSSGAAQSFMEGVGYFHIVSRLLERATVEFVPPDGADGADGPKEAAAPR
jgi:FKBP-type peptidyl-prolyl cis-trans isomerase (trigger factor)